MDPGSLVVSSHSSPGDSFPPTSMNRQNFSSSSPCTGSRSLRSLHSLPRSSLLFPQHHGGCGRRSPSLFLAGCLSTLRFEECSTKSCRSRDFPCGSHLRFASLASLPFSCSSCVLPSIKWQFGGQRGPHRHYQKCRNAYYVQLRFPVLFLLFLPFFLL